MAWLRVRSPSDRLMNIETTGLRNRNRCFCGCSKKQVRKVTMPDGASYRLHQASRRDRACLSVQEALGIVTSVCGCDLETLMVITESSATGLSAAGRKSPELRFLQEHLSQSYVIPARRDRVDVARRVQGVRRPHVTTSVTCRDSSSLHTRMLLAVLDLCDCRSHQLDHHPTDLRVRDCHSLGVEILAHLAEDVFVAGLSKSAITTSLA